MVKFWRSIPSRVSWKCVRERKFSLVYILDLQDRTQHPCEEQWITFRPGPWTGLDWTRLVWTGHGNEVIVVIIKKSHPVISGLSPWSRNDDYHVSWRWERSGQAGCVWSERECGVWWYPSCSSLTRRERRSTGADVESRKPEILIMSVPVFGFNFISGGWTWRTYQARLAPLRWRYSLTCSNITTEIFSCKFWFKFL